MRSLLKRGCRRAFDDDATRGAVGVRVLAVNVRRDRRHALFGQEVGERLGRGHVHPDGPLASVRRPEGRLNDGTRPARSPTMGLVDRAVLIVLVFCSALRPERIMRCATAVGKRLDEPTVRSYS
jgi:hypothetical protein